MPRPSSPCPSMYDLFCRVTPAVKMTSRTCCRRPFPGARQAAGHLLRIVRSHGSPHALAGAPIAESALSPGWRDRRGQPYRIASSVRCDDGCCWWRLVFRGLADCPGLPTVPSDLQRSRPSGYAQGCRYGRPGRCRIARGCPRPGPKRLPSRRGPGARSALARRAGPRTRRSECVVRIPRRRCAPRPAAAAYPSRGRRPIA
jgi:hypothetical protein